MHLPLEELISLVKEQKKVYIALLELSHQKRQVLVGTDKSSLDIIVQAEEELLLCIASLEKSRYAVAEQVAAEMGIPVAELTLSNWPEIDTHKRAQLDVLQTDFKAILAEIDQLNQVNGKLLQVHLDYVRELMKQVTHIRESTSYDADGEAHLSQTQENRLINAIL